MNNKLNSLTTKKQTTKFTSANFQKMLRPSYIILRIQRLEGKQCRSRAISRFTRDHYEPAHEDLPYFFGYKMEFFSFQNNPKDLDPSCKTDLDLWDCLGRVKLVL